MTICPPAPSKDISGASGSAGSFAPSGPAVVRPADYLVRMAERCQAQTAVLYRNHENVLPLVDQLERKGIPYRLRNAEMTFFTHRVVADIRNIIAFAMNPRDTAVFLQIYYKIRSGNFPP